MSEPDKNPYTHKLIYKVQSPREPERQRLVTNTPVSPANTSPVYRPDASATSRDGTKVSKIQ